MLLLKKSLFSDDCERFHYRFQDIAAGYARALTTYDLMPGPDMEVADFDSLDFTKIPKRQEDPISYIGEPLYLPLIGETPQNILDYYWNLLESDNMVSLAFKFIDLRTGESTMLFKNKYQKVAEPVL